MTLAERLLAGEHHGCATWSEAALKLGVHERRMRVVRKTLAAKGHAIALIPSEGTRVPDLGTHESKPTVQFDANRSADIQKADNSVAETARVAQACNRASSGKWPSLAEFDAIDGREWSERILSVSSFRNPEALPVPAVPVGHVIHKVSTLIDGITGETKQQWIKTTAQDDDRAAWLTAIRECGENLPRLAPSIAPQYTDADLLAVYPVGDPHVGLLSWHEDTGENFDLEIAERQLVGAFQHLTALAPAAAEALLIFIGDNAHADGQANTTTKGTRVDVDGRTIKVARTQIRIGRRAVDLALAKHGRVRMIWERGNHDELIAAMVALAFSLLYENDPRVSVDVSPEMFHWFRFGQNLIGTHHGDKVKPMDLLGVMATDRQQDWGETKHRRFYCGHFHHQIVKEVPGLIVEYLPTLAGSDAWHRSMGYRSARAMYMDVFHREHGHVNRHIVGVEQVRAA